MSRIQKINATLPSPLTLQIGAAIFSVYNGTGIMDGGCRNHDCPHACQSLSQIFSSVATFQNCLAYPAIQKVVSAANATDQDRDIAQNYSITAASSNASGVVANVTQCLKGYCSSNPDCPNRTPQYLDFLVTSADEFPTGFESTVHLFTNLPI